jgi:ABC-type glycerol-3-phosphate transport system substrate-binding protein
LLINPVKSWKGKLIGMKILKRVTAVLLTAVVAVSFTACGGRSEHAKKLNIDTAVSINIWYQDDAYTSYLDYIAQQFHKANEFITVNPVKVEENNLLDAVYNGSIAQNNVADVYLMEASDMQRAYLMGLTAENDAYTQYYSQKHFPVTAVNAVCYEGKLYGYPVTFHTAVMVYNKKYTTAPENFEQIEAFLNSYQVTDENKDVNMIVGWDTQDLWTNYAFGGSYVDNGGTLGEDAESDVQTEALKAAMTEYAALQNTFGIVDKTQEEYKQMFINNQLIYTILDSTQLADLNASGVDYGICAVPGAKTGFGTQSLSDTTLAMVNPYSENTDTAKAVAQAISYDYADLLEKDTGYISARTDVADKNKKVLYQPLYEVYAKSDSYAKYIGTDEFYVRYSILLHNIWKGEDLNESVDAFIKAVSR